MILVYPALLSLPHIFWTQPRLWAKAAEGVGEDAVDAMAYAASVLKVVQFAAAYLWLWGWGAPVWHGGVGGVCAGLALMGVGQYLNCSVYKLLGKSGVYYGFILGKDVPWCTQWPFGPAGSLPGVPHPQYVGSALTVAGVACAAGTATGGYMLAWWSCLYALTALQEEALPHGVAATRTHVGISSSEASTVGHAS